MILSLLSVGLLASMNPASGANKSEKAGIQPGKDLAKGVLSVRPPLFWSDTTDTKKLDLVVHSEGDQYFLTNTAKYDPEDKNCFYFVNWDLQGTQLAGKPIKDLEVEPNSLYLVHLYELSKPKNLTDFWSNDPGKQASVAFVWVGGSPSVGKVKPIPGTTGILTEIKESPKWFNYKKGERLPIYSQRFPEFRLPADKVLSLSMSRTEDTFDICRRHSITHFQSGGGQSDKLPPSERLITLSTGYFNQGIGEKPSNEPHISPTENAFMRSDYAYVVSKAGIAADYDYMFLDEEFWHNDYQDATIERLCLFAKEARRINPSLKLADFWNQPPYAFSFIGRDRWSSDTVRQEALSHYNDNTAAMKSGNQTLLRKVTVNGKQTCLADELTAVSECVYFNNLFGYIDQYGTYSNDFFLPTAIHNTRMNKRMACNKGKPIIWFGMEILEGNYNHPRIAYPTRTTTPSGTAIFKDRLPVSPNYNEAIGLFGILEGDGVYLWEPHGPSNGDPNGIFSTLQYCMDYKDDRGEWHPDTPGAPLGKGNTWYPPYMYTAPDYYTLGAWKYSQIADVVSHGKKTDFEYSMDGGKSWYMPPANGGAMVDVIHDKRPIVTGAVSGQDIAVVAFNPFQGVADTTSLMIRQGKSVFAINLFGTRVRVYRGKLAVIIIKPSRNSGGARK